MWADLDDFFTFSHFNEHPEHFATLSEHGKDPDIGKPDTPYFGPQKRQFSMIFEHFFEQFSEEFKKVGGGSRGSKNPKNFKIAKNH